MLDIGAKVGAYALVAAALNLSTVAVEMHGPAASDAFASTPRSSATGLAFEARLRAVTGYVSHGGDVHFFRRVSRYSSLHILCAVTPRSCGRYG